MLNIVVTRVLTCMLNNVVTRVLTLVLNTVATRVLTCMLNTVATRVLTCMLNTDFMWMLTCVSTISCCVLQALLELRATPFPRNDDGETPVDVAQKYRRLDVMRVFGKGWGGEESRHVGMM